MYYNDYNRMREEEQPIVTDDFKVDGAQPKAKKKWSGKKIAALALACAIVGGAGGLAAGRLLPVGSTTLYEGEPSSGGSHFVQHQHG